MLRTSNHGPPVKPDIQRAIDSVLKEDSNFDRTENRSAHRESLVRPVMLVIRETNQSIQAFSRNVSATGIGLITNTDVRDRTIAILEIARLSGNRLKLLAECRWSKPYGEDWILSGWQFINLKR